MISAYYRRLTATDPVIRQQAARAWASWEGAALQAPPRPASALRLHRGVPHADAIARIECHYFMHRCFFNTDNWLIEKIEPLRRIPAIIIHGRYDIICPLESAWELHKAWPEAQLEIVPDAGHAASDPAIAEALIRATNQVVKE